MPDLMNLLGRTGSAGLELQKEGLGPEGISKAKEAFTQGLTNEQQDALANEILKQEGLPDNPGTRFAIRMLVDPLTYAGGSGGLKKLAGFLGDRFLPMLSKASQLVEKMGPPGKYVAEKMKESYDFMTFGGPVKREIARTMPAKQGADTYAQLLRSRHELQAGGEREPIIQRAVAELNLPQHTGELAYKAGKTVPGESAIPKTFLNFIESKGAKGSRIGGLWRDINELPKTATFALPFRHMGNTNMLGLGHYPGSTLKAIPATVKALAKGPEAGHEFLSKIAGPSGVMGSNKAETTSAFIDWISKVPMAGRAAVGGALGGTTEYRRNQGDPKATIEGALFGAALGAGAPGLYKLSQKVLWTNDDAIKANAARDVAQKYIKKGMNPNLAYAKAGKEVLDRMVSYGDKSPFTQWLANVAWFATWRSKLPGSVARMITEHPERVLALQRINPLLTGAQVPTGKETSTGKPQGIKSYLSIPEGIGAFDDPLTYGRGTLSPLVKGAVGAAQVIGEGKSKNMDTDQIMEAMFKRPPKKKGQISEPWWTSFAPPGAFAASGELGPFADPTGLTPFVQQNPLDTLIQSQTGTYPGTMKP